MGKHAKTTDNADSGDRKTRILKWLKITGIVAVIILLLGSVSALALVWWVSNQIHQDVPDVVREQITPSRPLAPQNILLLGSDTRGEKHARSDTIIIAHIDTTHKRVTMISIPRDMRVDIPGYGKEKINTAMFLGGPSLTIKTIKKLTHLPINHYAEVDFKGFVGLVNAVGGVWIRVDKRIDDPKAGSVVLHPGYQRLYGKAALTFVRTRKDVTGDYARMKRQQKFFAALLKQSDRYQTLFRIPQLINIFAENTETDMTLGEMLSLGNHMRSMNKANMEGVTLPSDDTMIDGVWYAIPRTREIAALCAKVRKNQWLTKPSKATTTTASRVSAKPIRAGDVTVEIKNGGGPKGSAKQLGRTLEQLGYKVTDVGNAKRADYANTQIVYRDNRAKGAKVEGAVGKGELVAANGDYRMSTDVLVIVGEDY